MKAAELDEWVGRVLDTYQVLAVDAAAFREWARLMHGGRTPCCRTP